MRIFFVIVFLLIGCLLLVPARKEPVFFDIQEAFKAQTEIQSAKKLLNMDWQEFCFFKIGGSEPYSAYWAYEEYAKDKITENEKLEKSPYIYIFVFKRDGQYFQFTAKKTLKVNGKKYWLSFPSKQSLGGCHDGDFSISNVKQDLVIKEE